MNGDNATKIESIRIFRNHLLPHRCGYAAFGGVHS